MASEFEAMRLRLLLWESRVWEWHSDQAESSRHSLIIFPDATYMPAYDPAAGSEGSCFVVGPSGRVWLEASV